MKSPGLEGFPACDAEVAQLAAEVWGPCDGRSVKTHAFGRGRVIWEATALPASGNELEQYGDYAIAARVLAEMGVAPDFESDGPIRYTHRTVDGSEVYFVANRESRAVAAKAVFRVGGKIPMLWDPVSGERRPLPEFTTQAGRTTVPLHFEAEQSFFIVFQAGAGRRPAGEHNFAATKPVLTVNGPWEVAFDPKWGGPEKITFAALDDWSKRSEPGIKFYSGLAVYRQRFELSAAAVADRARSLWLDLGVVKNLARVRLNGRDLGDLWCAPWRVDVSAAVRSGANELEITVANLWPNRLIGDAALPAEKRLAWTTRNPFKPDVPLLESGLLGPVTLQSSLADR